MITHLRTVLSTLLVALGAVTLAACSSGAPTGPGPEGQTVAVRPSLSPTAISACKQIFARNDSASPDRLVVVVDPTASVAAAAMPEALAADIEALSKADGALSIIAVDGQGAAPRVIAKNVAVSTPGDRDRPSVASTAALMSDCVDSVYLAGIKPTAPGTDLYRALATARELLTPHATLWTLSDMIATRGSLVLTAPMLQGDPRVAARQAAAGAPLDLRDITWKAGGIAASTSPLLPANASWLQSFTLGLCTAWGASGCTPKDMPLDPVNPTGPSADLPADPLPPFPGVSTTGEVWGCRYSVPGVLAFAGDSAALSPQVGSALAAPLAALQRSPGASATVVGHTASTSLHPSAADDASAHALSLRRALAVVGYLVHAGVASGRLHALGVGDTQPLHQDIDARTGRQNAWATGERRVDIEVRGSSC